MGFIDQLRLFLRQLFSFLDPRVTKAKRERNTLEQLTGKPLIEVALFQTESVTKARGRTPEQTTAVYLAQALAEAGFDYRIQYGYPETYDAPYDDNRLENLEWWNENHPTRAAHSNLLIYDGRGGRAFIGYEVGIVGLADAKRLVDEPQEVCESDTCGNVWAALHEVGHTLGGRHKTPMMQDKPTMLFHENMVELLNERAVEGAFDPQLNGD